MDIEDFFKITGANKTLRDDCINYSKSHITLNRSRYIASEKDAEKLLNTIQEYRHGVSASDAWDRWNTYIANKNHTVSSNTSSIKTSATRSTTISDVVGSIPKEIADCIVGLLAIVAEQQQKLLLLQDQIQSLGLLHVQSNLGTQASTHLTNALHNTLDRLDQSKHQTASVEIGTVIHKGRLSVENSSHLEEKMNSNKEGKQSTKINVDINSEISGLMKILASAKLGVNVNLDKVQERIESISKVQKQSSSEKIEGEYEVSYEGVKVVVGK
jgi:hypothetical protein